jgi:hypothetical protein
MVARRTASFKDKADAAIVLAHNNALAANTRVKITLIDTQPHLVADKTSSLMNAWPFELELQRHLSL